MDKISSNSNNNNNNFSFEKYYENPINQRNIIRKDNNGKIGVYLWYNKINNKFYIGSVILCI